MDDIADSNSTLRLPAILSTRAGGGSEEGRGLRTSYLSATEGTHRDSFFMEQCVHFDTSYLLVKVWYTHDVKIHLD